MAKYQVVITYPDGHIEEIEDSFSSLEAAREFGDSMIVQVKNTEAYHKTPSKGMASFMVLDVSGKPSVVVFESKRK